MTQVGELVNVALHTDPNPNCPFCQDEAQEENWKTYTGDKNNSTVLAANMRAGSAGRSNKDKDCWFVEQEKRPKPRLVIESPKGERTMSFQAHHAISGNQAMKGEDIEKWIDKDKGKIAAHTGYSINNPTNGVWLPSKPEGIDWSSLKTTKLKRQFAFYAMKQYGAQWHLGHHRIVIKAGALQELLSDEDALETIQQVRSNNLQEFSVVINKETEQDDTKSNEEVDDAESQPNEDGTYDAWLKQELKNIDQHISKCQPMCENQKDSSDGKPYVNQVINLMLNNLSNSTRHKLKTPAVWPRWNRYISRFAWEYSKLDENAKKKSSKSRRGGTGC